MRICVKFSFFNLKNGRQKLTIGFNFYFLSKRSKMKNENLCSVFFFFRNVKTYVRFSFFFWTENSEKKKEKKLCILTFNFFRKNEE